jgi:hypothetical protein
MMNERLGVQPHVVEAVVNHISGPAKRGVAGVYNRALYFEERQRALLAWASLVSDLGSQEVGLRHEHPRLATRRLLNFLPTPGSR